MGGLPKYLSVGNQQYEFLFDLDADREEKNDLKFQFPQEFYELKNALNDWQSSMPAPVKADFSNLEKGMYKKFYGIQ